MMMMMSRVPSPMYMSLSSSRVRSGFEPRYPGRAGANG
jgi:hypothetical protein